MVAHPKVRWILLVSACWTAKLAFAQLHVPTPEYPTVQAAIDAAPNDPNDPNHVIIVAAGTYRGSGNRDIDFLGKPITVRSESGDPNSCIIDCEGSQAEPHRGFRFHNGETIGSVLVGLTITNGYMNRGGALLCENDSSPQIVNCWFIGNTVDAVAQYDGGGAVYNLDSGPTFGGCAFTGNQTIVNAAYTGGGGMYNQHSRTMLSDCRFEGNTATGPVLPCGGGGVVSGGASNVVLTHCTFNDNMTSGDGGGMINVDGSHAELTNCTFSRNEGSLSSGGMINGFSSGLTLTDCTFTENRAYFAAGLYDYQESSTVATNCTFERNTTTGEDGGGYVANTGSHSTLTGCRFIGNQAVGAGACCGGMGTNDAQVAFIDCEFTDNSAENFAGGGLLNNNAQVTLSNCVVAGNSSFWGGGLWVEGSSTAEISNCTLTQNTAQAAGGGIGADAVVNVADCIIWGNTPSEISLFDGIANVTYSDVRGGWAGIGNIDLDPLFVDPNAGNYHLGAGSPRIDVGDPNLVVPPGATDLDGLKRVWDGDADGVAVVDMGAYEFGSLPYGDLNCDGAIDFGDINPFVLALSGPAGYHEAYPTCDRLLADINSDGAVNFADINPFVALLTGA